MNTVPDLHTELAALAERAPSDAEVRAALAGAMRRQARRRRTTSLIAVAAAVVVVAGGAGIAGAVLSHRSAGPAAPTPVVTVPDVPLPPGTKLIRHQLQAVTSPVTATPPKGMTGHVWMSAPGRLAVSFFEPPKGGSSGWASTPQSSAGYVITQSRDEGLRSYGPNGPAAVTVTRTDITVGGHAATLDTAPSDTNDDFGFPANRRISWRLSDGRWIHVWADAGPGRFVQGALESFAAGVTEKPHPLDRTVGIGLTLPGLTVDSATNSWPVVSYIGASVYLCPQGVDPMTPSYSSSTGSGSSAPDGSSSGPGPITGSSAEATSQEPTARCVSAVVMNLPADQRRSIPTGKAVTVDRTVVHVDGKGQTAWVDLGNGAIAAAGAPRGLHLSDADLAALAASVRLAPAATLLPLNFGNAVDASAASGVATVVTSASAAPMPASAAAPSTAATDRPSGPGAPGQSQAASTQPAQDPATVAAQRGVVTGYLDAVKARDCAKADTYWVDNTAQFGNGDLCHAGTLRLTGYRIDGAPATPSPDEAVFAVTITTTGGDVSMPPGDTVWFLDLHRQPSGEWRITGGGTGP